MNTGQIIKSKTTERFTVISNDILKSADLTMEEKGLLSYLLSLPSDWILYKKNLYDNLPDLPGTIDRVFKYLQDKGYIISVRVVNDKSQFIGWNHVVYDIPASKKPIPANIKVGLYEKPIPTNADFGESAPILSTNNILSTNSFTKTNVQFLDKSIKNQKEENTGLPGAEISFPFKSEYFKNVWSQWVEYRNEKKLPKYTASSLSKTFTKLIKDSEAKESISIEMIERAMSNNWFQIFPLNY